MTDEREKEITERRALDDRVEGLTRDLARTINAGAMEQREQLREMAIDLLRDNVEIIETTVRAPESGQGFNPFGIAIPLCLVGGVMLILFPPVGLLLFATAGLMMVWGVAAILFSRR